MVSTKHCCWGTCNSDSRYPERLAKPLKELEAAGKKAFIPFAKPSQDIGKCKRWINACSREGFDISKITRNTYICALHWVGEQGPTAEHPDPLKANLTPTQYNRAKVPKRKAPKQRIFPAKIPRLDVEAEVLKSDDEEQACEPDVSEEYICESTGRLVADREIQTQYSKYELSSKVETMILRNEVKLQNESTRVISNVSFEVTVQNPKCMKHFTGLTPEQFELFFEFLNNVCPFNEIVYWDAKESSGRPKGSSGPESILTDREKLYITLLRLRRGYTIESLAVLLSTPQRTIEATLIRRIFTTFIQFIYKVVRDLKYVMFPTRDITRRRLPKVFKTMKNIRCMIDCTEFAVEMSRNFARQGNTYSSYKHTNTFKSLIAVTPNGSACFVSELYEGDINDVEIFRDSGILKHILPGDIILADRGFTVQELLHPLRAKLKIPAFLKGRQSLSAAEELETRRIAKARIHIERFNQRLKQFRLIGRKIPLSLSPIATQMVVVGCALDH